MGESKLKPGQGAALVAEIEAWLNGWMDFPEPYYALVVAMWIINTHVYRVFDAVAYLMIGASTKQAGKTVLLELVSFLAKSGELLTDCTKASVFRLADLYDGWMTMCLDEVERQLGSENSDMRAMMNSGYRAGATLPRTKPGGVGVFKFDVYWPKAFTLIGDVYDTLRDRSIRLWLKRGSPARKYRHSEAKREAVSIVANIDAAVSALKGSNIPVIDADWLPNSRDEEIWTPLISLAYVLGLPKAKIELLIEASSKLSASKTEAARSYADFDAKMSEKEAQDRTYGERALRDLAVVCREAAKRGDKAVFSAVAVAEMRAMITAPWASFRGDGLTMNRLSDLLSPWPGLKPDGGSVQVGKGKTRKIGSGYKVDAVLRAAKELGE